MVPRRGLEPPLDCSNQHLKLARLPIPPPRQRTASLYLRAAHFTGSLESCQSANFPNRQLIERKEVNDKTYK